MEQRTYFLIIKSKSAVEMPPPSTQYDTYFEKNNLPKNHMSQTRNQNLNALDKKLTKYNQIQTKINV